MAKCQWERGWNVITMLRDYVTKVNRFIELGPPEVSPEILLSDTGMSPIFTVIKVTLGSVLILKDGLGSYL